MTQPSRIYQVILENKCIPIEIIKAIYMLKKKKKADIK